MWPLIRNWGCGSSRGAEDPSFWGLEGGGGVEVTASYGLKNKPKAFNVNVIAD